jgi:hypothetical protein
MCSDGHKTPPTKTSSTFVDDKENPPATAGFLLSAFRTDARSPTARPAAAITTSACLDNDLE